MFQDSVSRGWLSSTACLSRQLLLLVQREEAIDLVAAAIKAGIFNDLGSGSNVDVCVITKVMLRRVPSNPRCNAGGQWVFFREWSTGLKHLQGCIAWKPFGRRRPVSSDEKVLLGNVCKVVHRCTSDKKTLVTSKLVFFSSLQAFVRNMISRYL
jgi:hypothetical protein